MKKEAVEHTQRVIQTLVRTILSLGGHGAAIVAIYYSAGDKPTFTVPQWLPPIFALVITWYFATKETTGEDVLPPWQLIVRSLVRAIHALVGGLALGWLLMEGRKIPDWWLAIYLSILTFYFIEFRDPPKEKTAVPTEPAPEAAA